MKRLRDNQYFHLGTMILAVITISILLLAVVLNFSSFMAVVKTVFGAFSPVISGAVFAYLLNPLMNFLDKRLYPALLRRKMPERKAYKLSRVASLIFALLFALVLVYEFFSMLLPQLVESITGIINNLSTYYADAEKFVLGFLADNPDLSAQADKLMEQFYQFLEGWFNPDLLSNINSIFASVTSSVLSVIRTLLNLLIGVVAAVYILWSRDRFLAQAKKIAVATMSQERADRFFDLGRRIHKVFSGFIIGKLVDSLIIGVLCYIGALILRFPYPALVATVVGATNVIPFFGPFIGAIPCAFLILLVDPLKCLYFVIFIFGLQQLDGNVIGPRILGDTIGISGFWVLVSITVAGSLFGFAGMLLGVPVFAVLYMLLSETVADRLRRKKRPVETAAYRGLQKVEDLGFAAEQEVEQAELSEK